MPTYEYVCENCGHEFEELHSMDKKLRKCPECGKLKLKRLIGKNIGLKFIGPGFYVNDYGKKNED